MYFLETTLFSRIYWASHSEEMQNFTQTGLLGKKRTFLNAQYIRKIYIDEDVLKC